EAGPRPKRALTVVGLVVVAASAVFGADPAGIRERVLGSATPEARAPAASRQAGGSTDSTVGTATTKPAQTVLRSEPWWQGVTTLQGAGPMTAPPFSVDAGAIQWRVQGTRQHRPPARQAGGAPRPVVKSP